MVGLVRAAAGETGEARDRVNCVSRFGVATPLACGNSGTSPQEMEELSYTPAKPKRRGAQGQPYRRGCSLPGLRRVGVLQRTQLGGRWKEHRSSSLQSLIFTAKAAVIALHTRSRSGQLVASILLLSAATATIVALSKQLSLSINTSSRLYC
ncbi:hypothetical protein B296_00052395 [Ensete ventricosum]|uniref:Uncharacterized protein n=1 Tax=Ensete ventricosum TaxID=4639 RepID=A0A426YCL8_ENSVE|nr:hypothetical protein B296_00052395 [Ensete ventricosum]